MSFLVYIISGEGCPEEEEARKLVIFFGSKKSINLDCPATFFLNRFIESLTLVLLMGSLIA